jgi:hypothetical protein
MSKIEKEEHEMPVVQQINRCLKRHIKNDFLKAV